MHEISLKPEILWEIGHLNITNTLFTSFLIVVLLCILTLILSIRVSVTSPSKVQLFVESILENLGETFENITQISYLKSKVFSLLFVLFVYILVSNWFGLLPIVGTITLNKSHDHYVALFRAPTSDLSVTLGFALLSVLLANFMGLAHSKMHYFTKYINLKSPLDFFVGILELISELGKIVSFSFRLFGNVFAGEVLLVVITFISYGLATLPFMGLELFVGLIQAYVFFMLTSVFINLARSSH